MEKSEIKTGIIISYASLFFGNLIPFIYTPIMLRILGQSEYGIYGIAQSVIGYLGLLNFGIGGTIVRYLAKYKAEGDREKERQVFGLFLKIYTVIGVMVLAIGMLCASNLSFFQKSLTKDEVFLLRRLVILMTINMAVFMPFNVFNSMTIAQERFIFNKTIALLASFATPCLNLLLLYSGFGSVGIVCSSIIINLLTYGAYAIYVFKVLCIIPSFRPCGGELLLEILRFSVLIFVANIVDILFWTTDKIIIGWQLGSVATAIYNVGASFNSYVTSLSTAISSVLLPRITKMAVNDTDKSEFSSLFLKVGRLQFILISFIVSAFVAFGKAFIRLWAGEGYEDAYYVAIMVMIPLSIPLIQNTGLNILYATNRHKFRSLVYFLIAIVNVFCTYFWVQTHGILGASAATCVSYVIGNIIIINWYYYKRIGIDIPLFWNNIIKMSPVMFFMGGAGYVVNSWKPVTSWNVFALLAMLYSICYLIFAYYFMMNAYEKSLIQGLGKKFVKRFRE